MHSWSFSSGEPSTQVVMSIHPAASDTNGTDTLVIPGCVAILSVFLLLSRHVLSSKTVKKLLTLAGFSSARKSEIVAPGIGKFTQIFVYRLGRLLGCLALFGLSFASFIRNGDTGTKWTRRQGIDTTMSLTYLYAAILALLSINPKRTRQGLIRHVNCVLFATFCVYLYRDVFPLATFTWVPEDRGEGPVLWAKIALLFFTSVVIPLLTPRQYIPIDPLNPMKVPNPEQTASMLSVLLYIFVDPIVFAAYRNSHLGEEELAPLCDTDSAEYLKEMSFPHLDAVSGNKRHIFFGLLYIFRREFVILSGLQFLKVVGTVLSPVAMNRLLQYLETKGVDHADAFVRPWLWILLLFLAPTLESLAAQLYLFINTRVLVQSEAIITELVFTHSLRIRVKAETTAKETMVSSSAVAGTPRKAQGSLTGKINNLVTTDLKETKADSRDFLYLVVFVPTQIALCVWFLYAILGWAAWVALVSIVLLIPVPGYVSRLTQRVQRERLKHTDQRVQSVSEAMSILRMVKLFGWELKMGDRIGGKRDAELIWMRKRRLWDLFSSLINSFVPVVTMISTLIMRQPLNASKVFSSMTVFDLLSDTINQMTFRLNQLINGKVSFDRANDFLKKTELLDTFDQDMSVDSGADDRIGFRNATFSWAKDHGSVTPSQRDFLLKIEGEIIFERGRINLVVGPTGSGEMHWIPLLPDSWYNLPRAAGIAYAAQESWVLNATIRDNIIFNTPFDADRYEKGDGCALEPDLALFEAGDATEVGERGLTLSGGQKARLTLARAVYSTADILLLDDVLAALDVHTSQWIIDNCFAGDLVRGRTVILVSHNVALTRPIASFIVSFGSDGRVQSQGSVSELTTRGYLAAQIREQQEVLSKTQEEIDPEPTAPVAKADGKLIVAEEIQRGHVSSSAVNMYLIAMGGRHPFIFFIVFLGGVVLNQVLGILRTWTLAGVVLLANLCLSATIVILISGQLRVSKSMHGMFVESVLRAPLRWIDVTPVSRVIARCTSDMAAVDSALGNLVMPILSRITRMLTRFGVVLLYAPAFFVPGLLVGSLGAWVGQIYTSAQLPVKRLRSNAHAPVLGHLGTAIAGLVSIRAFGAESKFSSELSSRIDRYSKTSVNFWNLNRWVAVRINILGSLFSAALATYLVYVKQTSASETGFLINMAVTFTSALLTTVRLVNEWQRLHSYIHIDHEEPATESGKPPAYWPGSGDLKVEHLSAKYSEDGPTVLHDISFHIKSGERVGIVGRTGSGKSSLTLSLLRCIPTTGKIHYDGLPTSSLNLNALRSSITIIPQIPELLSGSLRSNLDPFSQYDDEELNYALRAAGLFALQSEIGEDRITLDTAISSGGNNFSIGEKQIFALARAIVRKSKILILDEDYKTDSIIQTSLRTELKGDVTLITVAHRLQTIMDADKIMVLDAGRIVEFDSPKELLKIRDGRLRAMVDESNDRDALYAMAIAAE
ncbi:multidrug resistance-associated ABC transporter [Mycena epipterygia]|nr:multidrug resistance-associated ABC transporter [Mycena epipterygia]